MSRDENRSVQVAVVENKLDVGTYSTESRMFGSLCVSGSHDLRKSGIGRIMLRQTTRVK